MELDQAIDLLEVLVGLGAKNISIEIVEGVIKINSDFKKEEVTINSPVYIPYPYTPITIPTDVIPFPSSPSVPIYPDITPYPYTHNPYPGIYYTACSDTGCTCQKETK